jgi:hypothetical protein
LKIIEAETFEVPAFLGKTPVLIRIRAFVEDGKPTVLRSVYVLDWSGKLLPQSPDGKLTEGELDGLRY